jgi:phosphohistidine phosphatase SixA
MRRVPDEPRELLEAFPPAIAKLFLATLRSARSVVPRRERLRSHRFDAAYSSSLVRARETATILAAAPCDSSSRCASSTSASPAR